MTPTAEHELPEDLDAATAAVYHGPFEEFVARRNALSKRLAAAGRQDEAAAVKGLRKPTRTAWALNAVVASDPPRIEQLTVGVNGMLQAQSGRGDLRGAMAGLRSAVQDFAAAASSAASEAGFRVDQAAVAPALMLVVGDPDAFEALSAGRLVDVPATGGLDRLTEAAPPGSWARAAAPTGSKTESPPVDRPDDAAARQALEHAEADASAAHARAEAAEQSADEAAGRLEAAEEQLHLAEQAAEAARTDLRHARRATKTARDDARRADRLAAKARGNLG